MEIPFAKAPMAGNELKYLQEVLESGWLTTASKAMKLEQSFRDFVGAKFACSTNSCTSALHLAIEALGIKAGDKVIVPSLTFTATAEVVRYVGADPIFLDVEYGTGLISPSILEEALNHHSNLKAVIVVHYGGQAATMNAEDGTGILDMCKRRGVKVIEDAAHAFPTKHGDQYIGSFGDVTCFSFYANKTITTGEGGMLVTNDKSIFDRARIMRMHGIDRDIWMRHNTEKSSWEYDVVAPGFKYNMPDINAAIGLAQLEKAEYFRQERQRCAEFYYNELSDVSCIDLPLFRGPMESHSWHLFPIILLSESPVSRNDFIRQMSENGIGTSVHYKPLYRMSYYQDKYNLDPEDYPNSERIWTGLVSLPIYSDLKDEELKYIGRIIKRILTQ